ncbi:hypothetical protein [Labedaea rhizosphaerae]|uniref:Uncharacterized protein n=1 Tax=Labedaea rhizosphaerae TaxID=598644 RepID=A0A4R6SJM8_LABRH|nr:hypothetical protein [Labedaea rhizosphaerae]TDQ04278.1 hypothetical protein EV186_101221 [Labedaea rhizosphaerae]
MNSTSRWTFVPTTRASCYLSLLAGVLILVGVIWQFSDGVPRIPVLPIIAAVAAVAAIGFAIAGLVSPRSR